MKDQKVKLRFRLRRLAMITSVGDITPRIRVIVTFLSRLRAFSSCQNSDVIFIGMEFTLPYAQKQLIRRNPVFTIKSADCAAVIFQSKIN